MIVLPFSAPPGFEAGIHAGEPYDGLWFVFRGDRLLVEMGPPAETPTDDLRVPSRPQWVRIPSGERRELASAAARVHFLGNLGGTACYAAEHPHDAPPPDGWAWEGLRTLFSVLDDAQFAIAGRALQVIDWDRTHRFCGRCGTATEPHATERVRTCPACRLSAYPRVAPAIMALVRRGPEILLGRSPHFPPGMYSALAGFVEPGESLEQCVHREVGEEVGLDVTNIRYFASQSWPFPHSLMIAFTCDWVAGEVRPEPGEIEAAAWFQVFDLPRLPSRISIARRLIDDVVADLREQYR